MLIDFDSLSYIIGFLILAVFIFFLKKKFNKSNMYILFFSIFFFYLLNVIKYTIFPIEIGTPLVQVLKEELSMFSNINLIPFKFQVIDQTLYNVLLTIPFGFGLPYIKRIKNLKSILIWGLTFSFLIELTQFTISLIIGYPYRVTDINDIIANTCGAIIGFLLFKIFSKIIVKLLSIFTEKDIDLNPFLNYIYNISKTH